MLAEVLLSKGIQPLELGIAGPLAGFVEAAIYPHAATGQGSMLANLGANFVEACLLLEAIVTHNGRSAKDAYSALARWHLQHGPYEGAGVGLLPCAAAARADSQIKGDILSASGGAVAMLHDLQTFHMEGLRERFHRRMA